jgi:invasion protein IalB
MTRKKAIALAALAAALAVSAGASAQETQPAPAPATPSQTAPKPQKFDDWDLFCPERKTAETQVCEARTVVVGKQGQRLGALVVAVITEAKTKDSQIIASALVPLGVDLTMPPALKIDDGKAIGLKYLRCLQRGCEAMVQLSPEQQTAMQSGTTAKLAVGIGGGKDAVFEFSLKGFTAAMTAMKKETGAK